MKENKMIELGTCTKPHGIKGAFSFNLHNRDSELLKKGILVIIKPMNASSSVDSNGEEVEISSISFGNKVILGLKGVEDRNKVEAMLPFSVEVPRDMLPDIDEDEVYLSDLLECEVFEWETERPLGKVLRYFDNTAQIILTVRGDKTFDIPFVEAFVPEVDMEQKKIWVIVPKLI